MDKEKRLETIGELKRYLDEKFKMVVPMEFKGKEYMGDIARKLNDALQNDREEISVNNGTVSLCTELGEQFFVGFIVLTYTEVDKHGIETFADRIPLFSFDFKEKHTGFIVKGIYFEPVPFVNDECSLYDAAQIDILLSMANKAEVLDRQLEVLDNQIEDIRRIQSILYAEGSDAAAEREIMIEKLISSDTFAKVLGFPANMCLQFYTETSDEIAALIKNKEEISKRILSDLKECNLWSEEENEDDSFEKRYIRMVYVKRATRKHAEEVFTKEYGEKRFRKMLNRLYVTLEDICGDVLDDYCDEDFSDFFLERLMGEREAGGKTDEIIRKRHDFRLVQ